MHHYLRPGDIIDERWASIWADSPGEDYTHPATNIHGELRQMGDPWCVHPLRIWHGRRINRHERYPEVYRDHYTDLSGQRVDTILQHLGYYDTIELTDQGWVYRGLCACGTTDLCPCGCATTSEKYKQGRKPSVAAVTSETVVTTAPTLPMRKTWWRRLCGVLVPGLPAQPVPPKRTACALATRGP